MRFVPSEVIPEVIILEPDIFQDSRGFFTEIYRREAFEAAGIKGPFVQDNLSRSRRGSLRGLHYQLGRPQGKLVWVLSGKVFDVAVDIRRNSPGFGRWFGAVLSDQDRRGLYIPPDFAHGFCVLSDTADFFYKCTDVYAPDHERGIRWDDPDLAIEWPVREPTLSERDGTAPLLRDAQLPFHGGRDPR